MPDVEKGRVCKSELADASMRHTTEERGEPEGADWSGTRPTPLTVLSDELEFLPRDHFPQ